MEDQGTEVKVPSFIESFLDPYFKSLLNKTTQPKSVEQLDPLVWGSFTQTFTVDPKTLFELCELQPNSTTQFQRELDPEIFHWHGTAVYFLDPHLLKQFWKRDKVCDGMGVNMAFATNKCSAELSSC